MKIKISPAILFIVCCLLFSAYSFSQGTWTQKADFGGVARKCATSFSIGTKGYIGTGWPDNGPDKKDFWEWNQASNVWTQKADFGGYGRIDAAGFSIGTKGYIGAGSYNDFWEWDQAANAWTKKADFSGGSRRGAVHFSIGTKGYIGTGLQGNTFKQDFWEWNQATNVWTQKAAFGGAGRSAGTGFSIGTKGYIGTGYSYSASSGNIVYKDFWEWDQATNVWTKKTDFGGAKRLDAVGFSIGNKGYIGTGLINPGIYKDFWEWDQATDVWTKKADFGGIARAAAEGFSIGDKGYIGIGWENCANPFLKDFWEFNPNALGINEQSQTVTASVFPNPFSTQATFSLSKEIQNGSLAIYDLSGKEVKNINFSGNQIMLERENIASGTYFYKIVSENKFISSGKLLIQ